MGEDAGDNRKECRAIKYSHLWASKYQYLPDPVFFYEKPQELKRAYTSHDFLLISSVAAHLDANVKLVRVMKFFSFIGCMLTPLARRVRESRLLAD